MLPRIFTFVDVETTGLSAQTNSIIEIGMLRVEDGVLTSSFSSLINPRRYLPPEITRITGIKAEDLTNAPTFTHIAEEVKTLLQGSVLVAHNARFDYSFLKHEFQRIAVPLSLKQLCTVRLAKFLYPSLPRHNLDSIIHAFSIPCPNRHRAFDDAKVLYDFLEISKKEIGIEKFSDAVSTIMRQSTIPQHIRGITLRNLPETPGVYTFFGENKLPLYIGKSTNIKKRVYDHFRSDIKSGIEMRISQQIRSVAFVKTPGELGALLLESRLIKEMQPLYNRKLRHKREMVFLREKKNDNGYPILTHARESSEHAFSPDIVGMFSSILQAKTYLLEKAKTHSLCQKLLGLEKTKGACFGYRLGTCHGACIQKEDPLRYTMRHILAFAQDKIKPWPFPSAIAITEEHEDSTEHIIVDKWVCIGSVIKERNKEKKYKAYQQSFDLDMYRIMTSYLYAKRSTANIRVLKQNEVAGLTEDYCS